MGVSIGEKRLLAIIGFQKKKKICIFIFVSALITVKQNYRTCDQVLAELENIDNVCDEFGIQMVKLLNLRFERSEKRAQVIFGGVLRSKTLKFENPQIRKPSNSKTLKFKNPQFRKHSNSKTLKFESSQIRKPSNSKTLKFKNPRSARNPSNLACSTRKRRLRIRFVSLFLCLL